jgi:hypothetical protein
MRTSRGQSRQCGDEFLCRQRNANDAGGRRKDLFRSAAEELGGGLAGGAGRIQPGLANGAVGVAGVDSRYAHFASAGPQMFFIHNQRSRGDAVGRKGGSGARGRVGHNESKVWAAALFKPRFGSAIAKAARERDFGGVGDFNDRFQSI